MTSGTKIWLGTLGLGLGVGGIAVALGGRGSRSSSLGRSTAACSLQSAKKVRKILGLENGKLPEHVEKFGRYMMWMAGKKLAPTDVAKAYLITISSMQRSEQGCDRVHAYWPEAPCTAGEKVRPEHIMAQILTSPDGKRYLAAAARGRFDARAASWIAGKFASFGLAEQMMSGLKTAPVLAKDTEAVDRIIKTGSRRQWQEYVAKNIKGVSYAKSGFLAAIMGRGDMATADARQIGLWDPEAAYGGKIDANFVEALNRRLRALDLETPPELRPFYEHLVHHTIWDRMGGARVFHTEIKDCMSEGASPEERARFLGGGLFA